MNRPSSPGGGRVTEPRGHADSDAVAWAKEFVAGTHYCDYGTTPERYGLVHPHDGCECPCSLCFSFWHFNVFRFEDAKRLVREAS